MAKKRSKNAHEQNIDTQSDIQLGPLVETQPVEMLGRQRATTSRKAAIQSEGREPASALKLGPCLRYAILGALLFLLLSFQGGGDDAAVGVGAAVLFLLFSLGKRPLWSLRHRLSIPVMAVFAYVLLNFVASLYSKFGTGAAESFGMILTAFCVFALVILRARQDEKKHLAAMLSSVLAAFALLSIDASSLGVLSRLFIRGMDALGCAYGSMPTGYEAGVRITGVFGNANILAGMLAFGVFLSLYLLFTSKTARSALGAALLLSLNAVGFLLAFSMGAIAMFAVAALCYLLLAGRSDRLPLFLLMVESALVTLAVAFLAFPGLGAAGGASVLPVLAPMLGSVALWALDRYVGRRAADVLSRHGKAAGIAIGMLVAILALYIVLAYQLAGGYTLSAGESLRRSVYPTPGTYTLAGQWDPGVTVAVESQNNAQAITHTSDTLYQGPLDESAFTVPEDSEVVYLTFFAPDGAHLESVALSNGASVRLGYHLLPGFAANRIQGLWANENAIQRSEFFRDGMKMYSLSPLIGNGLGSVSGLVTSVQRFYYESRYVHNHYIQALAEMGIPGLLAFLVVLSSCALTLLRRRREEGDVSPLLPALGACLAMAALHASTEAVWSIGQYQTVALLFIAMIAVYFGRPMAKLACTGVAWAALALAWVFVAGSGWLIYGHVSAARQYQQVKSGQRQQTAYTMSQLARKDPYDSAQYKLDMAINAIGGNVPPEFQQTAQQYNDELRELGIYSINRTLELYRYPDLGQYDQLFAASREGLVQKASDSTAWQDEFALYQALMTSGDGAVLADMQWFAEQVLLTWEQMETHNAGQLIPATLTPDNLAFLEAVQTIRASGADGETAAALLRATTAALQ